MSRMAIEASVKDSQGWQVGFANGWYVWDGKGNLSEGCSSIEVAMREAFAAWNAREDAKLEGMGWTRPTHS